MNKRNIAKQILTSVASLGVGTVVTQIIKHTTPVDLTPYNKVAVAIGGIVIGSMVADVTTNHINGQFDEIADLIAPSVDWNEPLPEN